jgi:hypothetical protein
MKIYTPVKGATGVWCSVYFNNGVGETKNPRLIKWFKDHGYKVEDEVAVAAENKVDVVVEPDYESMTYTELKEWMKDNGYGSQIKNVRSKAKLIEIIKG